MKIVFFLHFQTMSGQNLLIVGSTPGLGQWDIARALRMRRQAKGFWKAEVHLSGVVHEPFTYRYAIEDLNRGIIHPEGGQNRCFSPPECPGLETIVQRDFWRPPVNPEDIFASAPFRRVIFRRPQRDPIKGCPDRAGQQIHVRLRVPAATVAPGYSLYVTGDIPTLGFWNPEKALPLQDSGYPDWQVDFHARGVEIPFQYKYIIADPGKQNVSWESGDNRCLLDKDLRSHEAYQAVVVSDNPFRSSTAPWKGAGLSIPVFSLRTERGLGVGEFPDLKLLADWAKQTGFQMIQILPVNDTSVRQTWRDAYPYAILSVFALHPLYLNLQTIEGLSKPMIGEIDAVAKRLNEKDVVDYEAVMSVKMDFLKRIFTGQAGDFLASTTFQTFLQEHAHWLKPYASFCHLRDRYGSSDHRHWGEYSRPTPAVIEQLTGPNMPQVCDVAFHYFIQYHLHKQLLEASEYARDCGIVLKGDIPIGIYKTSVETWLHPQLFRMDKSAGAPPDDFAVEGQNWGFPTYDWETMAADGYGWWKKRLIHLSRYFDAIRLDHVIGFFRIWEIPSDAMTALRGRFHPVIPLFRKELEATGIKNIDSLCDAYITDDVLKNVFGERAQEIIRTYLEPTKFGRYRFRPEFDSQKKIAARFTSHHQAASTPSDEPDALLRGLYRLHDDVVLIPDKPGDREYFHPRIAIDTTFAFKSLDKQTQAVLRRFYEDYFFRRQEFLWAQGAREKLSALKSTTDMMICGEDLGMVPSCVAGILEDLGLLSLRIQRMPVEPWAVFSDPAAYPYLSVASPSTHDMSTIRGWWQEAQPDLIQFYCSRILGLQGAAPETCEPWICSQIVALHLHSGSLWAVFLIQDILGMSAELRCPDPRKERINEPADAWNRWDYRLHLTLETLLQQHSFNSQVSEMMNTANRFSKVSY